MNPEQLAKSGTEHGEQMALMCWCNMAMKYGFKTANDMSCYNNGPYTQPEAHYHYPQLKWIYAIPNAGARGNKVAAGQLKAEGLKSGVADICLPVTKYDSKDKYIESLIAFGFGLYIELKRKDGVPSDVSDKQNEFGAFVTSQGYLWKVCFGWQQARDVIQAYLT